MEFASSFNHCLFIKRLATAAALALLVNQATAATFTWTGTTTGNWSTTTNWSDGAIPAVANTTDVIMSGTTNVGGMFAGGNSYTVRSLTFDDTNDANTLLNLNATLNPGSGSRTLTFSSDSGNATLSVAAGSTGDKTINRLGSTTASVILTSSLDISHNGSGTLTFGTQSVITSGGGINKSGTGTLSLLGNNTYTGATNVTGGTLNLRHATDTLSSSSAVTVDGATAILSIAGNSDTVGAVSLKNGGSITGSGGTLTGTSYAVESGSVSAILGGAGIALTKSTAGTVTLSGANTYTGTTTIQNGTLALDGAANRLAVAGAVVLGDTGTTGKLVLGGTTTASQTLTALTTTGSGGSVVGGNASNSTLTLNIASSNTFAGSLGGAGTNENNFALTKDGAGTLILSGANTYTGATTINAGTLSLGHATDTLSSSSAVTVDGATAVLSIAGNSDTVGAVSLKNGGSITGTGGTLTGASYAVESGIVSAKLGGAGIALTKSTAGNVTLSGTNTYTGTTTVNAGTLQVASTGALSSGGITVGSTGSLSISAGSSATRTLTNAITLDGGTLKGGVMDNVATVSGLSGAGTSSTSVDANGVTIIIKGSGLSATTANLTLASGVTVTGANQLLVGGGAGGGGGRSSRTDGGGGGGGFTVLTTGDLSGTLALTAGGGSAGAASGGGATASGGTSSIGATTASGGGGAATSAGTPNGMGGNSSQTIGGITTPFTGGLGAGATTANNGGGGGAGSSANGSVGLAGLIGGAGGAGTQITTGVVGLSGYLGNNIFGGGGGGGADTTRGAGGAGGGGQGAQSGAGGAGTDGLGGGGGGGANGTTGTGGVGGAGSVAIQYAYDSNVAAGTLTLSGGITLNSTSTLDAVRSGGLIDVTTIGITGAGGLNIASSASSGGVVRFSVANTYAGDTTINSGAILRLNATNAMPFGSGKGNVSVTGMLDLNGNSTQINGLSGNGIVDGTSGTPTLTVGNNDATSSFGGIIQNTAGTLALTKSGAGTQTLSGTNTYTGGTTVSAGTLEVNNTSGSGTGSGTVTVNSGATLAGEGIITTGSNNYVYLNGTLQVGSLGATQGTVFSLTTSGMGSTILGGSSFTSFDLWNSASGNQSGNLAAADMLRLFGDFSITSGASLVLNNPNSRSFMAGDVFKLFDWAGLGTLNGTYGSIDSTSLGLGSLMLDTSNLYTTTGALAGTIGFIAVPEPSRALLMMLGVIAALSRRRRVATAA